MAKMGRPEVKIDKEQFESLCAFFCTKEDIAGFFKCSEDTIDRWSKKTYGVTFAVAYRENSAKGRVSLRRAQFHQATKGGKYKEGLPDMSKWLGKQELGQSDKQEIVSENKTIQIRIDKQDESL